jgi:3-methyladenine DNA glycosylase AlkD
MSAATTLAAEIDRELRRMEEPRTADVRALRRAYTRRLRRAPAADVLAIARWLLHDRGQMHRFVAYELIAHHRVARDAVTARDLEWLGLGLDSWAAVDTFAVYVAGPAWREGQIPDRVLRAWARSEDRWQRRAALVATVALNAAARGGRGETERTLALCRLLVRDRDDMVVKAMSWALRELSKRDPAAVRRFVEEQEGTLAARVKREVGHKLSTGLKSPRRPAVASRAGPRASSIRPPRTPRRPG